MIWMLAPRSRNHKHSFECIESAQVSMDAHMVTEDIQSRGEQPMGDNLTQAEHRDISFAPC